jgi:hypothetical protein
VPYADVLPDEEHDCTQRFYPHVRQPTGLRDLATSEVSGFGFDVSKELFIVKAMITLTCKDDQLTDKTVDIPVFIDFDDDAADLDLDPRHEEAREFFRGYWSQETRTMPAPSAPLAYQRGRTMAKIHGALRLSCAMDKVLGNLVDDLGHPDPYLYFSQDETAFSAGASSSAGPSYRKLAMDSMCSHTLVSPETARYYGVHRRYEKATFTVASGAKMVCDEFVVLRAPVWLSVDTNPDHDMGQVVLLPAYVMPGDTRNVESLVTALKVDREEGVGTICDIRGLLWSVRLMRGNDPNFPTIKYLPTILLGRHNDRRFSTVVGAIKPLFHD